jgi:hypothetical protein
LGGDPMIGRRLYPFLEESGFKNVRITPKVVYVDKSKPELVDGFIKRTIIAMVEGVKDQAIISGFINLLNGKKVFMVFISLQKTTEHFFTTSSRGLD